MSEKKEIKELNKEELEKVSGGSNGDFPCPHCGNPINYQTMLCNGFVYSCPHCKEPVSEI